MVHVDVISVLQEAWAQKEAAEQRVKELTISVYNLEEENILLREMAGVTDDE